MPDLLDLMINLGAMIPKLVDLLRVLCALISVYLIGNGFLELYAAHDGGSSKFLSGRERYSTVGSIISIFIGSMFLALASLELLNITTRSFTGDYVTSQIMTYKVNEGVDTIQKAKLAKEVIFEILQVVGFIAIIKALLIFKNSEKNPNQSLGKAVCFFVGGLAGWNAEWLMQVINNQMGINLIGLFLN